ncbi:MazG-like family protein [Jeotgalibaca porci]|uniref:MazG-like family protein n=1 Tax=Jeotgalibaca porci TaxID=1868793 RepID=UPI0035A0AF65
MCKDLNKLTSAIKLWSTDRNLHTQDHKMQTLKFGEEAGELFKAVVKNDRDELIDAVGDTYVTLVILCQQLGVELSDCVNAAYGEIKDRKGKLVGGTFIKEESG